MPQQRPLVYVIVLSWNGLEDTLRCLEALGRSDYPNLRTLVIDNGSTDGSAEGIAAARPDLTLVRNQANLGYGEGNNVGIRRALAEGAEAIVLLNNDAFVEPGTIGALVDAAGAGVAAVGGKVRFYDQPGRLWAAGHVLADAGYPPDDGRFDTPGEAPYIAGCCMLMSRAAIEAVGLLDGAFFLYFDEYEWCLRARDAGFAIRYTPEALVYHRVNASVGPQSPRYHYLFTRARLRFWELRGVIPHDWRRLKGVARVWLAETSQVFRQGDRRLRRALAVTRGAVDYLRGRFGAPPANL